MAGNNTLTVTIAGESKGAEDAFARVGTSAKDMDTKVRDTHDSFDKVGEKADEVDTKAMGFRDTLTGIQDSTKGIKDIASGNFGFESLLTLGAGIGDLGSGMFNFLVPAFGAVTTAVQGMNLAFLSSPIFWIIAAIVVLIGIIVLIATKTDWFQRAWKASWGWIKDAAGAAWDWIKTKAVAVWDWLKSIPGMLKTAFGKVADILIAPYKFAFNTIAKLWNATIGSLSWTVPGWIPGIGGNTISVPKLPTFHSGGTVPGFPGQAVPIMAMAGEQVSANGSGGRGGTVYVRGDGLVDYLIEAIAGEVRRRGGDPGALGIGGSGA
jgi:hypothetical protein